jgi:hypothetical protein
VLRSSGQLRSPDPAIIAFALPPIAVGTPSPGPLYEIDRIISRTIGWAVVTGILVAVFAGLVVGLQAVLAPVTDENTLAVAASTLVAFALFQPLRRRVQQVVDRRFDRARYDGERTARPAQRLRDRSTCRPETDITATIGAALRPSSTERGSGDRTAGGAMTRRPRSRDGNPARPHRPVLAGDLGLATALLLIGTLRQPVAANAIELGGYVTRLLPRRDHEKARRHGGRRRSGDPVAEIQEQDRRAAGHRRSPVDERIHRAADVDRPVRTRRPPVLWDRQLVGTAALLPAIVLLFPATGILFPTNGFTEPRWRGLRDEADIATVTATCAPRSTTHLTATVGL